MSIEFLVGGAFWYAKSVHFLGRNDPFVGHFGKSWWLTKTIFILTLYGHHTSMHAKNERNWSNSMTICRPFWKKLMTYKNYFYSHAFSGCVLWKHSVIQWFTLTLLKLFDQFCSFFACMLVWCPYSVKIKIVFVSLQLFPK